MARKLTTIERVLIGMMFGALAFVGCGVAAIFLAGETGVIDFGPCGLSAGPNSGTYWSKFLLCFPFIAAATTMFFVATYLGRKTGLPEETDPPGEEKS